MEIYNEKKLTPERLKSLINDNHNDLYISSYLIKLLMKENEVELLKIIFDNSKFYDNEFIKQLIYQYKYKTLISTKELNQKISNKEYKIIIDYESSYYYSFSSSNTFKIKNMNKTLIYYLVEHGIDINKDNIFKETPLFYTCKSGNKDLVEYLVKHGADINKKVLYMACFSGNKYLVKYLVEHGADINKENWYGESILFDVCKSGNNDLVEYLVEHGADINKESWSGETVLFDVCRSGNKDLVKYLVENGADIKKENQNGLTVLFMACESGNKYLVKYLVEHGADINKENRNGEKQYCLLHVEVEIKI